MARNSNQLAEWTLGSKRRLSNDRRGCNHSFQRSISVSFSVYVDNLPYEMDEVWLRQIFRSYGDVVDVFIPNKRSSRFNTKFGFVRFSSRAEALDAVQDLHGILIRDFRIQVNLARFSQASNSSNFMHKPLAFTAGCGKQVALDYQTKFSKSRVFVDDKSPSFADIVAGKKNSVATASIKVQDEGDLWLSMSAIAKLPSQRSIESLREAFIAEGVWNVQLRPMGVDTKGQNMSRANPSVVLRAVDESDVNSFSSVDPAGDKVEDDGRDDKLEGGTNNLDSNILIENSAHLSCFDVLESFVGETKLPILGDQAQISNLNVVDSSNSFVEESDSPLGNILYEDKSIHVENCLEANQADGNIFEDGAAYTCSGHDDSTSADLLVSNDKFKSIEHRVLANRVGPRVSLASFFTTGRMVTSKVYGPIKELLSEENQPKYRETTTIEYSTYLADKGLGGTSALLNFRL
ncbi:hypothetical protein Vadar_027137 [Vaccinium darrowii]|uniref:Uncharacterized protein n=1 Tax=Vaccinium darrowii TaxID=229202 RepID=A0ACB7YZG6_9ERIC|nr:hypothetical protein Vadar_027137 [Vaccinium darrowii]